MKSDERILGGGDYVSDLLACAEDPLSAGILYEIRGGYLFYRQTGSKIFPFQEEDVWQEGKSQHLVWSPSLLCFWVVRELAETMASLAQ